jgi:transglutaminase-like putative cysteine protease
MARDCKNHVILGLVLVLSFIATAQADTFAEFITASNKDYGPEGLKAAEFLAASAPASDKATLSEAFLRDNLALALDARERFLWAKGVPEDIFLNNVLPYASLDEKRDSWRRELIAIAAPLVKDCRTTSEAAQVLNRDLFQKLNVHYSTARKRANQSPVESIASGKASCTGLSILLVDACRAVGIPARVVGVAQWTNNPGNHTWVEIWDGRWHFMGAAEYSSAGLDHAWFADDIAHGPKVQIIYAASWEKTSTHFPLAWNPGDTSIPAVIVTSQYKQPTGTTTATVK